MYEPSRCNRVLSWLESSLCLQNFMCIQLEPSNIQNYAASAQSTTATNARVKTLESKIKILKLANSLGVRVEFPDENEMTMSNLQQQMAQLATLNQQARPKGLNGWEKPLPHNDKDFIRERLEFDNGPRCGL